MKFFVAFAAVLALASAQENCQRCGDAVAQLGAYLTTPAEIEAVEEGLVDLVCSTLEDPQGCAKGVYAWWPSIAEALFNYDGTAIAICTGIGACKKQVKQDVTCAECEAFLGKVAALLDTPEFAAVVAADLKGDVFCGDETYMPADQVETCQNFMDLVAEKSVNALGSLLKVSASRICTENGCTK